MNRLGKLCGQAAAAVACAACSLAPPYQTPPTPSPPAAYAETGQWKQAQPADALPRGAWWTLFDDATLNALEDKVAAANQDLKAAFARLAQARAAVRLARADYFPSVTVGSGLARTRQSSNGPRFSSAAPQIYNDYTLEADVSYEIDVWGRVRSALDAARAQAQASAADLAAVDLATHAELAVDYFMLRGTDASIALLDQTVAAYARALALTEDRYRGGIAAVADVDQAQTQLETARTQTAEQRLLRAQLEHAIAVLVGEAAPAFHIEPLPLTAEPPALDPGAPSALLERRPDIAAAERRVAAANAEIGVARAAWFPVFGFQASAGLESAHAASWLDAPSRLWSLGPSATLTLFDGGRRHAISQQARAVYDETVADYRSTVLNAYREVEDNLAAQRQLAQETASQTAAVAAARRSLTQAENRYRGGIATYLEVVAAQSALLQAQLSALNIQTRRFNTAVLLVKALGGGWSRAELASAAAPDAAPAP
jgi:NodT family efflux transporter outer membrane factor (OMF) lipoprotein